MKKIGFSMLVVLGVASLLRAQPMPKDTVYKLPEFTTNTYRFEQFSAGRKTTHTDSLVKQIMGTTSLAQLLADNSQLFVKSYGVGQLATTSFRGAGAAHTAILWNGINLQSTMHGQSDFNLIPVGLMDDVDVYYGGNSALYGGGAIGGAVALQNKGAYQQQKISYGVSVGSFEAQQHWLSVSKGNAKAYVTIKAYGLQARNNITYQNTALANKPTETLPHAEQVGYGMLVDAGTRLNAKHEVKLKYWYGFSDRNLPPTMGAGVSHSYQIDASHRALGEWNYQTPRTKITSRMAWLQEYINYQDPSTYITGKSTATTYLAETEVNRLLAKYWSANVGINNTYTTAKSEGYNQLAERNTTAFFTSVKYSGIKKVMLTGSARKEWVYSQEQPFTATLGAEYKLPYQFTLSAQLNKSYRLPTLNDLYWVTGNKNLQAEHGYGQELSMKKQLSTPHTFVLAQLNTFNRLIDDWIIWQPLAGTWTPQNLKQVWSRGLEWNARYTYCKNKWSVSVKTDWSYVLSTNQRANSNTDATVGKQLIYTPRLMHQHLITYMYDKFYVAINPTYTGYRFTASDNSTYINDYTTTNLFAGYGSALRNIKWQLRLQLNNCFNQAYQVLPARPMPLSNWQLTFQLTY